MNVKKKNFKMDAVNEKVYGKMITKFSELTFKTHKLCSRHSISLAANTAFVMNLQDDIPDHT